MDFYSMKRKKLQSLCKKHGIPANIKNKEMAEKLSFIYQGNEKVDAGRKKGASLRIVHDKKLNVDIIELDSESDTNDVSMEASDTVASKGKVTDDIPNQILPTCSLVEVNSSNVDNNQMAPLHSDAFDNMVEGEESKMNFSLERRDDTSFFNVQTSNHKHLDDNQELFLEAPEEVHITSEDFGNNMVEGEVDKVCEKTEVLEGSCGTEKVGDKSDKKDQINGPQISFDTEHVDDNQELYPEAPSEVPIASEDFGNMMFRGEVDKDSEKTDVVEGSCEPEKVGDKAYKKDQINGPQINFDTDQVDDNQEMYLEAPREVHIASEDFGNNMVEGEVGKVSEKTDVLEGSCGTEKVGDKADIKDQINGPQVDFDREQVDSNREWDVESSSVEVHVASEEFGYNMVEGEVLKLSEKIIVFEDTCGTENTEVGEKQDQINSPPGLNMTYVNPKEFSGCLVEEVNLDDNICIHAAVYNDSNISETFAMSLDASFGADDTDGKTNVTVEDTPNVVHRSLFEDSDWTLVPFQQNDQLSRVKASVLDVHKFSIAGTANKNGDTCGEKFGSSQKSDLGLPSEKMIGFSPKLLNNSETQIVEMSPFDVKENMNTDVSKDDTDHSHAEPTVIVMNDADDVRVASEYMQVDYKGLCDVKESLQIGVTKELVDHRHGDFHAEPSLIVKKDDEDVELALEDMQVDDVRLYEEENMHIIRVNNEKVDQSQEVLQVYDKAQCDMEENIQSGEQIVTKELANNLVTVEAVIEDVFGSVKGSSEATEQEPEEFIVGIFNMKDGMQSDIMEKENIQEEECTWVGRRGTRLFDKSDAHDDTGRNSKKSKRSDVDNANDPNLDEKKKEDEFVSTVSQPGEMDSSNFNLNQILESETAFEDKGTGLEGFDPSGGVAGISNMKEGMQSHIMEKENIEEEECSLIARQSTRLLDNSDAHDDTSRNSNQSIGTDLDNTNDPNSDEKEKVHEFVSTVSQPGEMDSSNFNFHEILALETAFGVESTGQEGFGPTGDDVGIYNIKEGKHNGDITEKENILEEEFNLVDRQGTMFDNSVAHDDTGRNSHKRKRSDVENANDPNSDEKDKTDELVSSNFNLHEIFPSETFFGDESSGQEGFDSSEDVSRMQSDITEKENIKVENCTLVERQGTMFDNSDAHDDTGRNSNKSDLENTNDPNTDDKEKADEFVSTMSQHGEMGSSNFNVHQIFASETAFGVEGTAQEGFCPSCDDVGIYNIKEGKHNAITEKENILEEEFNLVDGQGTVLFDKSVAHDDTGRNSHKRKRSNVDNTNDPNSDEKEKADEFVSTMSQPGEMDSSNFNLNQIFPSETVSGDEGIDKEKLELPPKGTPIVSSKKSIIFSPKVLESSRSTVGTCNMKENIKFDKNDQLGLTILKNKFSKRQPLQDLPQN